MARKVIGYHGTILSDAKSMAIGTFKDRGRESRWLGAGIYFFEYNPALAQYWAHARAQNGDDPSAVLKVELDLTGCLDLSTPFGQRLMRDSYRQLDAEWREDETKRKKQKPFSLLAGQVRAGYRGEWQNYGRNELDYRVVEKAVELAYDVQNFTVRSVRGIFFEHGPLYENSWFYEGAHVAIAVRQPYDAILNPQVLAFD